jgi:hypothetical protein
LAAVQDALAKEDLAIAQQELEHITSHPFWQQQTASLWQSLENQQQERQYQQLWQEAQDFLAKREPDNALHSIHALPDTPPWAERKQRIGEQATAMQRRLELCRGISLGMWNCY